MNDDKLRAVNPRVAADRDQRQPGEVQQPALHAELVAIIAISCYRFPCKQGDDRAIEQPMTDSVIHPPTSDADHLTAVRDEIDALLEQQPRTPYVLVGADGNHIELPASALEALRKVVEAMSRGESVTVISHDKQLTSQEAAEILSVSRPHLIKLLDRGELPFHRVGTHRRINIEDALAYRERRDAERRAALAELTRLSEELPGGYR